jgi:hypothetical protein
VALVSYRVENCTGPNGVSIDGRAWSDGKGEWAVSIGDFVYQDGQIRNFSVSGLLALAYDASLPSDLADQRIECDIVGDAQQLVGRYDVGADNYYLAYKIGSGVYLYRVDAGVSTFLDSGSWLGGDSGRLSLDIQGTLIRVYEGGSQRISTTDATYATGVAGIRITASNEFFDNIEILVDSGLITTIPPTTIPPTPAPTSFVPTSFVSTTLPATSAPVFGVVGDGQVIVPEPVLDFMAGVFYRFASGPTELLGIQGWYGDTATDVLTGGAWDPDSYVYYAYKQGANVRVVKIHSTEILAAEEWDVALATMNSSNGRAAIHWYDGVIYVWVHDDTSATNTPTIYRLDPSDGSIVTEDASTYWITTSRSPSAAVDAANPGGANNGNWPGIRITASRIFLLGGADNLSAAYLEIRNLQTGTQVSNITLQSKSSPDEVYPRGITVDPVAEEVFVTWADFNDTQSRDEANRRGYDKDGSQLWSHTTYVSGYTHVGQIFYDIGNDRLLLGGGLDAFGVVDESITVVNPATGSRSSGVSTPGTAQTVLGVAWDPTRDEVMISTLGTGILVYESDLTTGVDTNAAQASPRRVFEPFYLYAEIDVTSFAPTSFPGTTLPGPTTLTPETTLPPTTLPEPSFPIPPTTLLLTTGIGSTTSPPITGAPTTAPPTSVMGTTEPPTTDGTDIRTSISYVDVQDQMVVRAWVENDERKVRDEALSLAECELVLVDEAGVGLAFHGVADALGSQYVRFVIPNVRLYASHLYMLETTLVVDGGPTLGPSAEPLPVT